MADVPKKQLSYTAAEIDELLGEIENANLSTVVRGGDVNITDSNVADICGSNANNIPNNTLYGVGMVNATVTNFPQLKGFIATLGKGATRANGDVQIFISNTNTIYSRIYWSNAWLSWELGINSTYMTDREKLYIVGGEANITNSNAAEICNGDFNNLPNNRMYGVGLSAAISNVPALKGEIRTYGKNVTRSNSDVQVFTDSTGVTYSRIYWSSAWTKWAVISGSNLHVLALGDSICNGVRNDRRGFIGDAGVSYSNIGVSGATLSTKVADIKNIPQQLVDYTATTQPDAIISNGGVNDYYFSSPMGTLPTAPVKNDTEAEALDRATTLGGLQYLFYQMIKLYPKAHRFFLCTHKTTAKASNTDSTIVDWTITANSQGYTQTELFDNIKKVCKLYNVNVIDIFNDSPINTAYSAYVSSTPYNTDHSVTNSNWVDSDGIHPLAYGYINGYIPHVRKAIEYIYKK